MQTLGSAGPGVHRAGLCPLVMMAEVIVTPAERSWKATLRRKAAFFLSELLSGGCWHDSSGDELSFGAEVLMGK